MKIERDVAVIGGGSAGTGAALAASRLGARTLLIERETLLGGTSSVCGVNCWEPVAGATGIPFELYLRMKRIPSGAAIYSMGRHCCHAKPGEKPFPGGENVIDPSLGYLSTLRRSGSGGVVDDPEGFRSVAHGVVFEPSAFDKAATEALSETGRCRVVLGRSAVGAKLSPSGEIESVELDDGSLVEAKLWIDCSGALVELAGWRTLRGEDPKSLFQEPDAPETAKETLNGVTLIFRASPAEKPAVEELPPGVPEECWWAPKFPALCMTAYPNGDRNCNMLPSMDGLEYRRLGESEAHAECVRRVKAFWRHAQTEFEEFRRFRISWMAPRVGVRESFRTRCEAMLTEKDLLLGLQGQRHEDVVALSDHMMDSHGAPGRKNGELAQPYGIPYRCLIPEGRRRALVAGRFAGFSSVAASSCRLARTMIQLGQAAGTAAAIALKRGKEFPEVDAKELRESLLAQGVLLDWPMTEATKERISRLDA